MEIRIGSTSDYLIIKNLIQEGQVFGYDPRSVEFVHGTVQLNMNGISSNIGASFMLDELKQFMKDIQKLHSTLTHSFTFGNFEGNIELVFTPTSNGHIEIQGLLRNSTYTGSINFKIEIDQSYLPAMINNLNEVFHEMKIG